MSEPSVNQVKQEVEAAEDISEAEQDKVDSPVLLPDVPVPPPANRVSSPRISAPLTSRSQPHFPPLPSLPSKPPQESKYVPREHDILKQSLDRTLLCYCQMRDHIEQYPKDFSQAEVEAITDVAISLLTRVFETQLVDPKNDTMTRRRTMNYLTIYYQLHKLKQIQERRGAFLDEFTDVIEIGEMDEFFQETSEQFVEPIEQFSRELDAIVNPPRRSQKKVSLRDLTFKRRS